MGTHLANHLNLHPETFEVVEFDRRLFSDEPALDAFVRRCDAIVHLAALNRHNDEEVIHYTNISLVRQLVESLERTGSKAHVLMASSIQEESGTVYGRSKREGRELLAAWAAKVSAPFTGLIIPNVFGPFGLPHYNSVVATFCHQLAHQEEPHIKQDAELRLTYVGDLVAEIATVIENKIPADTLHIKPGHSIWVSDLLVQLRTFRTQYEERGEIPVLQSRFDLQLFNTYRSYMKIGDYFPRRYVSHTDPRGTFTELVRAGIGGQTAISTTAPGVTRGNHFHTRKIERFAVISGQARIQMRRVGTDEVITFEVDGSQPAYVDMPIWYTHNITNTGGDPLYTCFWVNEPYNPADPDTCFEEV